MPIMKVPLSRVLMLKGMGSSAFLSVDVEEMITLLRVSIILLEKAVARKIMRVNDRMPPMRVVCSG